MAIPKKAKVKPIPLTVEEREKWVNIIYDYFNDSGNLPIAYKNFLVSEDGSKSTNPLLDFCVIVVSECERGWPKAPNQFPSRLTLKTQWNSALKASKIAKSQEQVFSQTRTDALGSNDKGLDLSSVLTESERVFFKKRMDEYLNDFEFNTSSDLPLVERLIIDEVMYKRLSILHLESITTGVSRNKNMTVDILNGLIDDTHKRINELQKQLGISRQQRSDALNNSSKSIAELAAVFDEKVRNDASLIVKLDEEMKIYGLQKSLEEPINDIPDKNQLEQILKSPDSTSIYEQTAQYALSKAVPEIAKEKEEKDIQLPGGLSI